MRLKGEEGHQGGNEKVTTWHHHAPSPPAPPPCSRPASWTSAFALARPSPGAAALTEPRRSSGILVQFFWFKRAKRLSLVFQNFQIGHFLYFFWYSHLMHLVAFDSWPGQCIGTKIRDRETEKKRERYWRNRTLVFFGPTLILSAETSSIFAKKDFTESSRDAARNCWGSETSSKSFPSTTANEVVVLWDPVVEAGSSDTRLVSESGVVALLVVSVKAVVAPVSVLVVEVPVIVSVPVCVPVTVLTVLLWEVLPWEEAVAVVAVELVVSVPFVVEVLWVALCVAVEVVVVVTAVVVVMEVVLVVAAVVVVVAVVG